MKGLCCLLLVSALTLVAGQAPRDEQEFCTVTLPALNRNIVEDPPNGRILMDSSHYNRLLPPNANPVWQAVDLDMNNPVGLQSSWVEQQGRSCETAVTVCGWSGGAQDNWLITQHINRTVDGYPLQQVSVQIEYQQNICPDEGSTRCRRTFDLLKYETSTVNPVAAIDTDNYALIRTLTTQVSGTTTTTTEQFGFNTDESGFYLAIRDRGTCILISRLIVFYNACSGETVNLVVRPETIAPIVGSGIQLSVNASCFANSSPVGDAFSLKCSESGNWVAVPSSRCVCNAGFIPTMNGENCLSCNLGFYASVVNGECLTCPSNSNSTASGLAECPCDDGYYRTPQEVDLPCTLPPSPPLNVRVVNMSSTTLTLAWEEPVSTGGRGRSELRYNLWFSVAGETNITLSSTVTTTMGLIGGLSPDIVYTVFVTSETDITDQIAVEEVFILARGDTLVQTIIVTAPRSTTVPVNSELVVVGLAVSVVAVVIAAIAVIGVVICIACVYHKKRVRKLEIELRDMQMVHPSHGRSTQPNPSYGQVTQLNDGIVGTDSSLDGQYETVKDYEVVV